MVHEISQFDIPDRRLLEPEAQPKAGIWMDIGEARVTRTIFGRPRIRVVCERDKKRRAWLLGGLAVILICAAGWQGWAALQRILNTPPPLPLSARIRVGPPVFDSEDFTPASRKQKTQTQILLEGMATHRPPEPRQPPVTAAGKIAAKPANAPLASKDMAPLDAHNSSLTDQMTDQTGMPQPARLPLRLKARAAAASPAAQPAANKAAAAAPAAQPLANESAAVQPPAADKQPPVPATTKP